MNMVEETSVEFRLRKIDETRNYLLDEIKYSDFMSKKYKNTCKYVENLLVLSSTATVYVSVSAFTSLAWVSIGITNSGIGIKICAIFAGTKKCKEIIKKKKKKHDKIVLLGKNKLNTIEVLISKTLINSYISHDEFVSINNVLKEYNEMKEEINPETSVEYTNCEKMVDLSRKMK